MKIRHVHTSPMLRTGRERVYLFFGGDHISRPPAPDQALLAVVYTWSCRPRIVSPADVRPIDACVAPWPHLRDTGVDLGVVVNLLAAFSAAAQMQTGSQVSNVRSLACRIVPNQISERRTDPDPAGSPGGHLSVGGICCDPFDQMSHQIVVIGDAQQGRAVELVTHAFRGRAAFFCSEPIALRASESVIHEASRFSCQAGARAVPREGADVSLGRQRLDHGSRLAIPQKRAKCAEVRNRTKTVLAAPRPGPPAVGERLPTASRSAAVVGTPAGDDIERQDTGGRGKIGAAGPAQARLA
jgi:hypothetical protein